MSGECTITAHACTGRVRYRVQKRLFREPLVVLQVEMNIQGYPTDMHGSGPDFNQTYWRDATVGDITTTDTNTK